MCMSADDAHWRICADNAYLMRRCACGLYYALIRILRILCADAHNARMRMCAAAHYAVMRILIVRICAYYAHIILDAHTMRMCACDS